MKRFLFFTIACLGSLLVPLPRTDGADAKAAVTPEAVIRDALDAMNQGRIDDFVKAMHPDARKQFHAAMAAILDDAARAGKAGQILPLFEGKKSVEELKKLDDSAFFAAYLRGVMGMNPEMKRTLAGTKIQVLGHLDDGKETTHVVYRARLTDDGGSLERVNVATLRKNGTGWGMLLTGDLDAMFARLKQSMAGKFDLPDLKAAKIQILGHLLEKDGAAHVIYRLTLPSGDSKTTTMGVVSLPRADPDLPLVTAGKTEELTKLIRTKLGLE